MHSMFYSIYSVLTRVCSWKKYRIILGLIVLRELHRYLKTSLLIVSNDVFFKPLISNKKSQI